MFYILSQQTLWCSGILRTDPRIKDCYVLMKKLQDADGTVDRNTFQRFHKIYFVFEHKLIACFILIVLCDTGCTLLWSSHRCVTGFVSFILKAVQGRFVIPDFCMFAEETQKLFIKCKQLSSVEVRM